jgi:hypothetical protein
MFYTEDTQILVADIESSVCHGNLALGELSTRDFFLRSYISARWNNVLRSVRHDYGAECKLVMINKTCILYKCEAVRIGLISLCMDYDIIYSHVV